MDMVLIPGRTEESILDITNTIRKVVLESIIGTMGEFSKETGKMVKEMEKERLFIRMVQ